MIVGVAGWWSGRCGIALTACQVLITSVVQGQSARRFAVERSPRLRAVVCQQLRQGWSPASIAGRLPVEYAADESCRVSHEAIYQWVYAQPVSTLARELISLRTGRAARKEAGVRRPRRGSGSRSTSTRARPR